MKKIVAFILLTCMVLSLAACGKVEITMQEIYDAAQTEAMLKNHQSVYIGEEVDGEFFGERYLTKEFSYEYYPSVDWGQFMTDVAKYAYSSGDYLLYWFITPDGVGDFASERAERYSSVILSVDNLDDTIVSANKKDGRITVNSSLSQEILAELAEYGVTSYKLEYALDGKTHGLISVISDCTYDTGTLERVITEVTYDTEEPEMLEVFLKYENQTENLRNITVVSNPGTEKEESKSIQAPKGLIIGFEYDDAFADKVEFYTDAACTEHYDPYADTDSDLTIYVKWTNT